MRERGLAAITWHCEKLPLLRDNAPIPNTKEKTIQFSFADNVRLQNTYKIA